MKRGVCAGSSSALRSTPIATRITASLTAVSGQTASSSSSLDSQAIRVRHQVVEQSKGFGRQRHGLCLTPQAGVVRVQPEAIKAPLGRGGHGMSSRILIVATGRQLPELCPYVDDTFPRRVGLLLQCLSSAVSPAGAVASGRYRTIAVERQDSKKEVREASRCRASRHRNGPWYPLCTFPFVRCW